MLFSFDNINIKHIFAQPKNDRFIGITWVCLIKTKFNGNYVIGFILVLRLLYHQLRHSILLYRNCR